MYGGNGDDTIYGSFEAEQNAQSTQYSYLVGQGGKDLIRTDIYNDDNQLRTYVVFGDWGYGEEGDSYELLND